MTSSKKINKTLRLLRNELVQRLSSIKGSLPILFPSPEMLNNENIRKVEGRVFIYSNQIDQLFNLSEIEFGSGQNPMPIHLVVDLKNEQDFKTESLLNFFLKANSNSYLHFFFKAKIQDDQDWIKTEAFFVKFLAELKPILSQCKITFEVNGKNFLYADDFRGLMLKNQVANVCYFPHVSYFKPNVSLIQVKELFHVRMFFDALTRDKACSFSWRNYYREFAALTISVENSGWRYLSLSDKGINKTFEANTKMIPGDGLFIHEQVLINEFNPVIGFAKISELVSLQLRTKFFPLKNIFEFTPVEDPIAHSCKCLDVKSWKRVIITGWYGTETQGDKAIIGEVLHFIKSASPDCKIILTTLHNAISEQTNLELKDLDGVELIRLEKGHLPSIISQTDAVIVGGGPLMESASMKDIGNIFLEAYKQNKPRIIFGCGIGPIHSPEVERVTRYLLSVCNAGFVRDKESYDFANKLFPDHNLKFACDPAVGFVSRWRKENNVVYSANGQQTIATLLRANTNEFSPESNPENLRIYNESLAKKVAVSLDNIVNKTGASYELLHMNAPWVGGDDRIYNRILASQLAPTTKINLVRDYLTLEEHMHVLSNCSSALAMRYHGHIFCMAMGIPFLSLDYTGKSGKVSSLVNRIGYSQWSIKWDEIDPITMTASYEKLMSEREKWSNHLISEADKLLILLHQTYQEVSQYCPEN